MRHFRKITPALSVETIYTVCRTNSIIYSGKFGMTFPVVYYNSSHDVKILSYRVLQSNGDVCLPMFTRLIKVSK